MTLWKTDCCTQEVFAGHKREKLCEHGHLFVSEKAGGGTGKSFKTASEPDRDWADARAKVDDEGSCRICKRTDRKLEAAHVLGREHDEPKVSKHTGEILKKLYVHPDRIVPLCGPFPEGCHGDVDHNRVNLVHHLTIPEQVQAVKDAGGIAPAWIALAPVGPREDAKAAA
jgi:hypothetical protein